MPFSPQQSDSVGRMLPADSFMASNNGAMVEDSYDRLLNNLNDMTPDMI